MMLHEFAHFPATFTDERDDSHVCTAAFNDIRQKE
jgi:hypothetical protein